jgi:hypothetical protein
VGADRVTELLPWLLFLHLLGAIAGIGPTFAFSRITAMGRTEPVHSTFAVGVVRSIQERLTVPLALLTLGSGLAMIHILRYDLTQALWLSLSIVLFVSSFLYALLVQNRDLMRVIELASAGPLAAGSPDALELATRRTRLRWGGLFMRVAAVVILLLMIVKPF